jgi:hypothetical protein
MKSMLQNDPDRMAMISGGEPIPEIIQRINAAINTEVKLAKEFGDDYFNAGTGPITGRFSRGILGSSGQGLKAFTDMKKINNDMKGEFTDKQLVTMLNKGYQDAELPYRFELPKDDREKKAEGELVGGQKELDKNNDGDITAEDFKMLREGKQEGGMMMEEMPQEMNEQMKKMLMEEQQVPDEEMEEDYLDFIINEALTPEEEDFLVDQLRNNDELSEIFDKVIEVASEFTGSGPVEGPGTEVSDSIPARLSDGEFVFTAKATEQIGVDKLMSMMKEAEAAADERQGMQEGGVLSETTTTTRRFADPTQVEDEEEVMQDEKTIQDMRATNPRMQ